MQKDRATAPIKVENDFTSGDYLHGFLRGTRKALFEKGRKSITIGIPDVSAFSIGGLIALYERAAGFYGSLVNINAYNQPGVEAGKKAATELLQLQRKVRETLNPNPRTADDIADALSADAEAVYHLLVHLQANDPAGNRNAKRNRRRTSFLWHEHGSKNASGGAGTPVCHGRIL